MRVNGDRADGPPATEGSTSAVRPGWLDNLIVLSLIALTLLTFAVLFITATGATPAWWPW